MTAAKPEAAGNGFAGLGLSQKLLEAIDSHGFTTPTPIQTQAIPVALNGEDVVGIAQTGTGKTLAFGLPMLQRIARLGGRGLVILPTRELALQVDQSLHKVANSFGLRTAVLIGGAPLGRQIQELNRKPHIIIVTPGRLIDHMEQKTINLSGINILVLDEADRMLDMGFAPQLKRILEKVPRERQTMLFSATMPQEIFSIATKHMKQPVRIEVAPAGTLAERVVQELFVVRKEDKSRLLEALLAKEPGSVLVFSRTKHGAKKLTIQVKRMGYEAAEIHANRSLAQRRAALDGFKSGQYRVLIATDIAARGIDVTGIAMVINYDLPDNPDDYVHRIGRTGRAGREGKAISFATPDQGKDVRMIEKLSRTHLPESKLPELPPARAAVPYIFEDRPSYGSRGAQPHRGPRRGQRRVDEPQPGTRAAHRAQDKKAKQSSQGSFQGVKRFEMPPIKKKW